MSPKTPKTYFITGSSGIGKSTIISFLKKQLSDKHDVHDFDERLTEEIAMHGSLLNSWRKETTLYWIKRAVENAQITKSTVVVGLVYPKEVAQVKPGIPISFCLLDASDERIAERLMGKRFSTPDRILSLKKATGKTPKNFIKENKSIMENLRKQIGSVNGTIIDTTDDSPEQTAIKVMSWING